MRPWISLPLILFSLCALADDQSGRLVPWSPLNEEEIARLKARYPMAYNTEAGDKHLRDVSANHKFRERDILKVYPELQGSRKLSSCSNSIMQGATSIVFVSRIADHEVTKKTLSCTRAEGGVRCGDVKTTKAFFLKSPREPIELTNVPPDVAQTIAETYQARRVENLPDWMEGGFPQLTYIAARPGGGYTLIFGEYFCAGCSFRYDVRLDSAGDQPKLIVTGNADGGCF